LRVVTASLPQLAISEQQRRELVGEYEILRTTDSTTSKALISEEGGKLFLTSPATGPNPRKTEFARYGENAFRRLIAEDANQPGENVFIFAKKPDGTITFEIVNAETKALFGTGRRTK
jgi:hypothetical protein